MSNKIEKVPQDVIEAINSIRDIPLLKQQKAQLCAFSASAIIGAYDTLKGGRDFDTNAFEKLKALCLKHHKHHNIPTDFGLANKLAAKYRPTQPAERLGSDMRSAQGQGGSDISSPVYSTYKPIQAATPKDWDVQKVSCFMETDEKFKDLTNKNPTLAALMVDFMVRSVGEAESRTVIS